MNGRIALYCLLPVIFDFFISLVYINEVFERKYIKPVCIGGVAAGYLTIAATSLFIPHAAVTAVFIAVNFFAMFILYKSGIKYALFHSIMLAVCSLSVEFIISILNNCLGIEQINQLEDYYGVVYNIVMQTIVNKTAFFILAFVISEIFGQADEMSGSFFPMVFPSLTYIILILLREFSKRDYLSYSEQAELAAIVILLVLANFTFCRVYEKSISAGKSVYEAKQRVLIMEEAAEKIRRNYKLLSENEQQVRILNHDIKHHIAVLNTLMSSSNTDAVKEHLEELSEKISHFAPIVYTGNAELDAVLNTQSRRASQLGIRFGIKAGILDLPMDNADICTVFMNLLDNAIEGCEKADEKHILVSIFSADGTVKINIENSSVKAPKSLKSSKADKTAHGWGLLSVKQTLDKYGAQMAITHDEKSFRVMILINRD